MKAILLPSLLFLLATSGFAQSSSYTFSNYVGRTNAIGTNNGVGANALFNHPHGIAADGVGNVYVADTFNSRLRQVSSAGLVNTQPPILFNASAPGIPLSLYYQLTLTAPVGIALAKNGTIYVSDNYHLERPNIIYYGSYDAVTGYEGIPSALMYSLYGSDGQYVNGTSLAIDQFTNIYVGDCNSNVVFKIDSGGNKTILGIFSAPPKWLALDQAFNLYVADGSAFLHKINSNGVVSTVFPYSAGLTGVAVDSIGNVYTVTSTNGSVIDVLRFDAQGNSNVLGQLPTYGIISGIAVDGYNNVFLSDQDNSVIIKGTPNYPTFFNGQSVTTNGFYFLTAFGNYSLLSFPYVFHADLGWEYFIDVGNSANGAYLYDFASGHFWYTSPATFPYLYDFTLNSWLYYFPDTSHAGHYTTNPRVFYNFATSQYITL